MVIQYTLSYSSCFVSFSEGLRCLTWMLIEKSADRLLDVPKINFSENLLLTLSDFSEFLRVSLIFVKISIVFPIQWKRSTKSFSYFRSMFNISTIPQQKFDNFVPALEAGQCQGCVAIGFNLGIDIGTFFQQQLHRLYMAVHGSQH